MFRKFGLLCALLACFSLAGGHWAVLQGIAWARMAASYAQQSGSVVVGLGQTFDGAHACDLCRTIQLEKSKERKGGDAASDTGDAAKVKALPAASSIPVAERATIKVKLCEIVPDRVISWTEPPPTPPPRLSARAA